jgi:hypothetical protein
MFAWMSWRLIEERVKMMVTAEQFRTASASVPGASGGAALACALVIVVIWTAALALIMTRFAPQASSLLQNPLTYFTGSQAVAFANMILPLNEFIAAVFGYLGFRIASYGLAVSATIGARFVVGL